MTDQAPATPIVVNANPAQDQAAALLRVVLFGLGSIVTALGFAKAAGVLGVLANLAGPIITVLSAAVALAALVWGQIKTVTLSKKAAAMANLLPDDVAQTR